MQIRDSAQQLRALKAECGKESRQQKIAGIREGALSLTLEAPDDVSSVDCKVISFNAQGKSIIVAPSAKSSLTVLIDDPIPTAWYSRWYVWTAVAVAVAAGGATAAYLGTRGSPEEEQQIVFSLLP